MKKGKRTVQEKRRDREFTPKGDINATGRKKATTYRVKIFNRTASSDQPSPPGYSAL